MTQQTTLTLPNNLLSIPSRKFKLDRQSEYYSEDRTLMKQYQMVNFKELYERFDRIIIFDIHKIPGAMLADLRDLVRNHESEWFMGKKTVLHRIISEMILSSTLMDQEEREALKQFDKLLAGEISLVFTNRDPSEMIKLVESVTLIRKCMLGELMLEDVDIYEGDTEIEPFRTEHFHNCNIPTKIFKGQIRITQTTTFLKKNSRVTSRQIRVLELMRMKPIRYGCVSKHIYERKDRCNYKSELLNYNLNPSVYEAMNDLGSLSLECSLINQLTIIAELKKSIQNIMIVDTYVDQQSEGDLFELD